MRLEHPEYLWLFAVLVVLSLTYFWARSKRKKQIQQIGDARLVEQLMPERSKYSNGIRFVLMFLAMSCIIIALANPQVGSKQETVKRKGVDIAIALDLSNSMMAEDTKPNRLERSKQFISKLIDKFQNDRVAFVIFAGNAYLQMPLTIDYSAFNLYLKNINTGIIPTQGTAIGDAIMLAENAFDAGEKKHKALIIISDGENHDEEAIEAAKEAHKNGTKIFTIGVGTPKGNPIPIYDKYGQQTDYLKDKDGSIVLSKLNEKMLQEIALNGGGSYYRLTGGNEVIKSIMSVISEMETKEIEEQVYTDYEDQFQFFLFFGLVLILIEVFINTKKSKFWTKLKVLDA
ncbi:MAG: VWA domain-containing protein [Chitinophagales bacterium]